MFIEDLTWVEVDAALKAGKTTALIYTGGAEQNGPHLAFGKHNAVARYLSERIARELGNALVYPVLPYTPAGDPSKKEGQFAWPGTSGIGRHLGMVAGPRAGRRPAASGTSP